jgi:ribosomal protein S6
VTSYECAIVFYPNLSDEGYKSGTEKYARVIDYRGGELTGLVLHELGRQLRIDESVLRHLIIKDELAKGDEPKVNLEGLEPVRSGPKEGK